MDEQHLELRIEDHEKRIRELERIHSIMEKMALRIELLEKNVQSISDKLDINNNEKGKKWDKLVDYLFYFVVATILGYVAIKLGLK